MRLEVTNASLPAVKCAVEKLAGRIDAPEQFLPTYGRSEDFARPHIEVIGQTYHYVVVERGQELERKSTKNLSELLYWNFKSVTSEMSYKFELQHRIENQDCRRIAFAKKIELMGILDLDWGNQMKQEIERFVAAHPYSDKK